MGVIKRGRNAEQPEKVLDVDASMQGTMSFKDPVNLRINGKFEGKLETKGSLTIGQNAEVKADINGEEITVAGRVIGNIVATKSLSLISPAHIDGDITTPVLSVSDGSTLNGRCKMSGSYDKSKPMTIEEVAGYLEIETSLLDDWATQKKIPAMRENNSWKFFKEDVDSWVAREKVGR